MIDDSHEAEVQTTLAILSLIILLLTTLFTSYFLQSYKITFIHESIVGLLLGMITGIILRFAASPTLLKTVSFDHRTFFNMLLPPVILHSGYDFSAGMLYQHITPILTFAFIGTFISAFTIGTMFHLVILSGFAGISSITYIQSLMIGSILSSTDPITVLAMFNSYKVEQSLHSIIFGESMLNDAVAIVLFTSLSKFNLTTSSIVSGIAYFAGVFIGSCLIGIVFGLSTALLLKHTNIRRYASIEVCLVLLLAYTSYLISNVIELSGIVSILFCGMTMRHYLHPNLSDASQQTLSTLLQVISHLSENFIFIYLGVTVFAEREVFRWFMVLITFLSLLIARAVSVFPLASLMNFLAHQAHLRLEPDYWKNIWANLKRYDSSNELIPRNHQVILWWSGLRGAIAFALSMESSNTEVRSTVLMVVVLSILLLGGSTNWAIKKFNIRTGETREEVEVGWFSKFDQNYLIPIFTHREYYSSGNEHDDIPLLLSRRTSSQLDYPSHI